MILNTFLKYLKKSSKIQIYYFKDFNKEHILKSFVNVHPGAWQTKA
jgi:hypothetical protein